MITVPLTHMNVRVQESSLIPRPSRFQLLIAVCNQKLEAGRPGNEAKRGSLVNLCERSKEREENGVEEKGKERGWRRGKRGK